jgi:glycosyltransferase involved in cell wall biosynthesis
VPDNNILLSVCVLTFNHSSYIKHALDSILQQSHTFGLEIIVADDYSQDGTREIIKEYATKKPDLIKIIPRVRNVGAFKNLVELLGSAQGKYIALCEGDDYWTDPLKLQKQVDFMESNPGFSICFHAVEVLNENAVDKTPKLLVQNIKSVTTIENLCEGNYIYTASCLFRNHLFEEFPEWYETCPLGDWPLHLLNALHGKIKFINEPMAVYRMHSAGWWSQLGGITLERKCLKTIKILTMHFENKYKPYFMKGAIPKYIRLIKYTRKQNISLSVYYFFRFLFIRKYDKNSISISNALELLIFG